MDTKAYIESGILEFYVAGTLPEQDMKAVQAMAHEHDDIAKEIDSIEEAYLKLAKENEVKASPTLKNQLLNSLDQTQQAENHNSTESKSFPQSDHKLNRPQNSNNGNWGSWSIAMVASVLLVVSIYFNFRYYNAYRETEDELISLREEQSQIAENYNKAKHELNLSKDRLQSIGSSSSKWLSLGSTDETGRNVSIAWNKESGDLFLKANELEQPGRNKQYQLWALKDGKPISAGVFDYSSAKKELVEMQKIKDADAFAITLEPKGGSKSPTLDQMKVYGELKQS